VNVFHIADRSREIPEIVFFREPGELGEVIQAHVDEPLRSGMFEPAEKRLR
jgi:hypothetical protein